MSSDMLIKSSATSTRQPLGLISSLRKSNLKTCFSLYRQVPFYLGGERLDAGFRQPWFRFSTSIEALVEGESSTRDQANKNVRRPRIDFIADPYGSVHQNHLRVNQREPDKNSNRTRGHTAFTSFDGHTITPNILT